MPQVKVRLNCWLSQGLDADSSNFEEIRISVLEGESVLGLVRRLAAQNGVFRRAILNEKGEENLSNIVVILNGRIVDLDGRVGTVFKEGDEVTFLPMLYGG